MNIGRLTILLKNKNRLNVEKFWLIVLPLFSMGSQRVYTSEDLAYVGLPSPALPEIREGADFAN
jgi:hypothetical protein